MAGHGEHLDRERGGYPAEWVHPKDKLTRAIDQADAQAAANSWFLLEAAHCEDREAVALAMQRVTEMLAVEARYLRHLDQP